MTSPTLSNHIMRQVKPTSGIGAATPQRRKIAGEGHPGGNGLIALPWHFGESGCDPVIAIYPGMGRITCASL